MSDLYNAINMLAALAVLFYNLCHIKQKKRMLSSLSNAAIRHFESEQQKQKERKKWEKRLIGVVATDGFWAFVESCILFLVQSGLGLICNNLAGEVFDTGLNYFGTLYVVPLAIVALCAVVKIDPLAQLDLLAPSFPLSLTFAKIACRFAGCCRGVQWIYGFYNPTSRLIEFPIQLLEAAVVLMLFVFLMCFKKRFKKGTVFPVYLMMYCAIRFFTEFLRCDPEVLWGLKTYHFLCIAGVILGVVEYVAASKCGARMQKKTCSSRRA